MHYSPSGKSRAGVRGPPESSTRVAEVATLGLDGDETPVCISTSSKAELMEANYFFT